MSEAGVGGSAQWLTEVDDEPFSLDLSVSGRPSTGRHRRALQGRVQ